MADDDSIANESLEEAEITETYSLGQDTAALAASPPAPAGESAVLRSEERDSALTAADYNYTFSGAEQSDRTADWLLMIDADAIDIEQALAISEILGLTADFSGNRLSLLGTNRALQTLVAALDVTNDAVWSVTGGDRDFYNPLESEEEQLTYLVIILN